MSRLNLVNPLMVALDMEDGAKALAMARSLSGRVGAIKLGPRLTLRNGPSFIGEIASHTPVFLDHKFFDIPSAMEGAIRASFDAGASYATVHSLAGTPALHRLGKLEAELNAIRPFQLLAVTILTSFQQSDLPTNLQEVPIENHVEHLASLVHEAGLSGLVCSPKEVAGLRGLFSGAFLVTPGIRFSDDNKGDQARTLTPKEAVKAGASAIVVGRPILESPDPIATVERILSDIGHLKPT